MGVGEGVFGVPWGVGKGNRVLQRRAAPHDEELRGDGDRERAEGREPAVPYLQSHESRVGSVPWVVR